MKEEQLDIVLVPLGLLVFGCYHIWLIYAVKHRSKTTVIGLNSQTHQHWVVSLMEDPVKNGVLTVQTIRNNMMASTLLATTAITLSSIIAVFVSNTSSSTNTSSLLIYGSKDKLLSSAKYFTLILCFLVAFLFNVESIRYYAHLSFLATTPTSHSKTDAVEYAVVCLNRGSFFWSLGLRAFYLSFPLFLWIFGPIPMFVCSCLMSLCLYFLDTTSGFMRKLHRRSLKEKPDDRAGSPVPV